MDGRALELMLRRLVVIDYETEAIYGPVSHRPPKPVGVAIRYADGKTVYLAWGHPEGNNCSFWDARNLLTSVYHTRGVILGFHNSAFDLAVGEAHMGLVPPDPLTVHDSLLLAYLYDPLAKSLSLKPLATDLLGMPPDEQDAVRDWLIDAGVVTAANKGWGAFISKAPADIVGPYAIGDVDRTYKLIRLLLPEVIGRGMGGAYDRERRLLPHLHVMTKHGVRVDRKGLAVAYMKSAAALELADANIRSQLSAPGLNIDANADLADALDKAGKVKQWGMTPTGKRKTSRDALISGLNDPELAHLLAYRGQLATVVNTFMEPWLEMSHADSRLHPEWNPIRGDTGFGTRTGRLSSSQPNFQNIIGESRIAPVPGMPPIPNMRKFVLPEPGQLFMRADFNGQEIRILGHFAEGGIKEIYDRDPGADIHTEVQKLIRERYGKNVERKDVKIILFSLIYGAGIASIASVLRISGPEAAALVSMIYRMLPGVKRVKDDIQQLGNEGKYITTWGCRRLHAPFDDNGDRKGYALLNYLIQGSAADQTKEAIVRYGAPLTGARLLATVHDELCASVPAHRVEECKDELIDAMTAGKFDVPMRVEIKSGKTWGDGT